MFGSRRRKSVRKKGIIDLKYNTGEISKAKQGGRKVPETHCSIERGKRSPKTIKFSLGDGTQQRKWLQLPAASSISLVRGQNKELERCPELAAPLKGEKGAQRRLNLVWEMEYSNGNAFSYQNCHHSYSTTYDLNRDKMTDRVVRK